MRVEFFSSFPTKKGGQPASPLTEIGLVILFVLIAEWAVIPLFGKGSIFGLIPVIAALVIMLLSHWLRHESPRELGFRLDNFARCLLLLLPPMFLGALFLATVGWMSESLQLTGIRFEWNLLQVFAGMFLWGFIQQYALQAFINRRSQEIWRKGFKSVLVTAAIFALMHLPNFWLVVATFFGGLMWAWVYQRAPNLFALGLSHAVMTIVLVLTVPYGALHGLRVGYGYYLLK